MATNEQSQVFLPEYAESLIRNLRSAARSHPHSVLLKPAALIARCGFANDPPAPLSPEIYQGPPVHLPCEFVEDVARILDIMLAENSRLKSELHFQARDYSDRIDQLKHELATTKADLFDQIARKIR